MSMFNKVTKTFQWGQNTVTLETGEIARQASGAVLVNVDDTVVLATVVAVLAPGQHLPLAFLIFPSLVWGAVRLAPTAVVWQVFGTAVGLTAATILEWGFFSESWGLSPDMTGFLLQAAVRRMRRERGGDRPRERRQSITNHISTSRPHTSHIELPTSIFLFAPR